MIDRNELMSRAPPPRRTTPVAIWIGLALWAIALAWWFVYYAQWQGAFELLGLKLSCLSVAIPECRLFQQEIASTSSIPTYSPVLWWAGCIAMVVGFMQSRGMTRSGP